MEEKNVLTALRKALVSADTVDLRSEDLDPVLHEELVDKQPLVSLFGLEKADGKTHEFRRVLTHPKGWFEGEVTPANSRKGTYGRDSVQLKILRNWGSVSGFNQAVTDKDLDALAQEIDLSLQGVADIIEWSTLYGSSGDADDQFSGDAYQYTGILPFVYSEHVSNVINGGGNKITLDELDQMIDAIDYRGTDGDPKFFSMSSRMKQITDGLQTKVQMPIESMELFDGKLTMGTYDTLPIFKTNMLKAGTSGVGSLAAVAGSDVSSGAANEVYGYRVSSVTFQGECVGVAEAVVTPTADFDVDLSWTADADAYAYMIFREPTTAADGHKLVDIIPALTYDSDGTVNGTVLAFNDADFAVEHEVEPLEAGEEIILLANASSRNGASYMGLIDSMGQSVDNMVSYVPLARTKDTYDYMLKAYLAMKIVNGELFSVLRHVKLA